MYPRQTPGAGLSAKEPRPESSGLPFPRWVNGEPWNLSTGPRRRRDWRAVELSLAPGWRQSTCHSPWALTGSLGRPGPAPPRPTPPSNKTRSGCWRGPEPRRCRRHRVAQSLLPPRAQAHPAQMESRPQRRRRSRQLVAAFLHDPGSGRVYRRGKLIGKVGDPARARARSHRLPNAGRGKAGSLGRAAMRARRWRPRYPEFGLWAEADGEAGAALGTVTCPREPSCLGSVLPPPAAGGRSLGSRASAVSLGVGPFVCLG